MNKTIVNNTNGIEVIGFGTERKPEFLDNVDDFSKLPVTEIIIKEKSATSTGKYGDNITIETKDGMPIRVMGADIANGVLIANGTPLNGDKGLEAKKVEELNDKQLSLTKKGRKLYLNEVKEK